LTIPVKKDSLPTANCFKVARKGELVNDVESLSHIQWECKYQLVFIPKYRKKALYGALRQQLGELLRRLATRERVGSKKGI
jgi:hypothetical protein